MKAKNLTAALKLISKISNPSSLTLLYRSVELKGNAVRAISEFGNIHISLPEDTGVKSALLETQAVLAITSSLPQDSDIVLEEKANHVSWKCKEIEGKGKLNYVVVDSTHIVPEIVHDNFPWQPPAELANALLLASSACQLAAVSFGLYGITIEPAEDKVHMLSSNTISLASTQIEKGSYPSKKITIRPPVPGIIATILAVCDGKCSIDVCDDGIYILGDWLMAHLPLGVNLEHDLKEIADKYQKQDKVISVNTAAVKKFITRASNLTERHVSFTVSMKIEEGKLLLEHKGISSTTEQYFIAEGLDSTINYETVSLPADLLLSPLECVDRIVCDYLDEKQLVLRGSNPEFLYVVGGN